MFLPVSCLFAFPYLLCFVHVEGQLTRETENQKRNHVRYPFYITNIFVLRINYLSVLNKETGEFYNWFHFINYVLN